ncbi:MAG TPA: TolC family outer membrane protein [Rhodanobacter sp.]
MLSIASPHSIPIRFPRRVSLACCLALASGTVGAQAFDPAAPALGMTEAVREAVQTHPGVRNAEQLSLEAGEGVKAARSGYLPQVRLGVDTQNTSYDDTSYDDARHVYTATLTVSQTLYDFGKVAGEVDKAKAGVRASEAQVQLSADQVASATAQAWVDAHLQLTLAQIAREQLDGVQRLAALVAERAAKGATTRSDVEQANSRVDAARSQLLGAEADVRRASLALMHLTGRAEPVAISGDPPDWLAGDACRIDGKGGDSPSVRLAVAQRDEAQADLRAARAQRLPTLSLQGSVGHALNDRSKLYGEYQNTSSVGVNLAMPLYEGGGTNARARAARYELSAAAEAADQARLETRQNFSDAQAQAEGWAQRAPVLQTRVESIHATRDLYQQQYLQMGTRSLLDLLNAEQEFHTARIDQAQGLHEQYRLAVLCLYNSDRLRSAFGLGAADASGGAGR